MEPDILVATDFYLIEQIEEISAGESIRDLRARQTRASNLLGSLVNQFVKKRFLRTNQSRSMGLRSGE